MKRLTFLLILIPLSLGVSGQFRAVMLNTLRGEESRYTVYSDLSNYRYEFDEEGNPVAVIVRPQEGTVYVLFPRKKYFRKTGTRDLMNVMNDPVQGYASMKKYYTEKGLGDEKVSGYDCQVREISDGDTKILTVWYSDRLRFPVKMENHLYENTRMFLSDIEKWKPVPSFFEVPEGYSEVDKRGRPVIPEPPPPEQWVTKKVQLPFQGAVSRGTLLVFPVEQEGHYKLIARNTTDKPARIMRATWRDGKELPEKVQGPEKYRTLRLYPGEKVPETLIWKAGSEIHIKVYEGTMELDIMKK